MTLRNRVSLSVLAAISVASTANAATTVLFDNLAGGYDPSIGWTIDANQSVANPFTSSIDGLLTEVHVALWSEAFGAPSFYDISVVTANGSLPGATTLYQWDDVTGTGLNVLNFSSDVAVSNGGSYFLVVAPGKRTVNGAWSYNLSGDMGPFAFTSGGNWFQTDSYARGGMKVIAETDDNGTPAVPGPLAALPFALGFLARRRRR